MTVDLPRKTLTLNFSVTWVIKERIQNKNASWFINCPSESMKDTEIRRTIIKLSGKVTHEVNLCGILLSFIDRWLNNLTCLSYIWLEAFLGKWVSLGWEGAESVKCLPCMCKGLYPLPRMYVKSGYGIYSLCGWEANVVSLRLVDH